MEKRGDLYTIHVDTLLTKLNDEKIKYNGRENFLSTLIFINLMQQAFPVSIWSRKAVSA